MRYFDHDTTAAGDDLIMALRIEHGGAAVDCYWAVLEQIYREEAPSVIEENRPETKALCARLAIGFDVLEKYVSTMVSYGLLEAVDTGGGKFTSVVSKRAMENIGAYRERCEKNRVNGQKGGRKPKRKANGNRAASQSAADADSERQAKKRKEKKVLGFDKQNPNTGASDGADVDSSTPPAAPVCPLCSKPVRLSVESGEARWLCEMCGEVKEPRFVEEVVA